MPIIPSLLKYSVPVFESKNGVCSLPAVFTFRPQFCACPKFPDLSFAANQISFPPSPLARLLIQYKTSPCFVVPMAGCVLFDPGKLTTSFSLVGLLQVPLL